MAIISDDREWLECFSTPYDRFIQQVGGEVVISTDSEVIFKVSVQRLLKSLEPIQHFYLAGQRSVDEDRVEKLMNSQLHEYEDKKHYGITTTMIILGFCRQHVGAPLDENCKPTNKNEFGLVVLDGQHRLSVFRRLRMFHEDTLTNEITLVKICKLKQESDLLEHFQTINKNYVPVPMYNLDDQIKGVVDGVINWLKKSFDAKFFRTPNGEASRPFIKLETVRDKLSNSQRLHDLIREKGGDIEKCISYVCYQISSYNKFLSELSPETLSYEKDDYKVVSNAHTKCLSADKPLYVGMKKKLHLDRRGTQPQRPYSNPYKTPHLGGTHGSPFPPSPHHTAPIAPFTPHTRLIKNTNYCTCFGPNYAILHKK